MEEPRANINWVLRGSHSPKSNISKAEAQTIKELKGDKDRLVSTTDKGVAFVVMDRQDYITSPITSWLNWCTGLSPGTPLKKLKLSLSLH